MSRIIVIFLLVLPVFSFSKINYNGISSYLKLYPKEVKALDNNIDKLDLKKGLATYWKAKKTTMFSKKNLKVYCIYEDLKVYKHVTNATWYYNDVQNKGNKPIYNFFICDNEEMRNNILKLFPNAEVININNTLSIIKTKDFTFSQIYEVIVL